MQEINIFIDYDFIDWNKYINAERSNKYYANSIKQKEKQYISASVKDRWRGEYPVRLIIKPHFKNKRKDLDNFRLKGLIDGLVCAGVLKNDNLSCIQEYTVKPVFDDVIGVEVKITEMEE